MGFGIFVFENVTFCWLSWMLMEYDTRFYRFHEIHLLCDHQELACTPKDPPWRVNMKERSSFVLEHLLSYRQNRLKTYSCGTVWKPHMCSYILIEWIVWINFMCFPFFCGLVTTLSNNTICLRASKQQMMAYQTSIHQSH